MRSSSSLYYSMTLLTCIFLAVGFIIQSSRVELWKRRAVEQWESAMSLPDYPAQQQQPPRNTNKRVQVSPAREIMGKYVPLPPSSNEEQLPHQYTHPVPLESILDENNTVIGDPGWLLDFGIIGYGKCGTSTMMIWLLEHPEVQAFGKEMNEFMQGRPGDLIYKLYTDLAPGPYQRGYKAPQDVTQRHILDYYRQYWPHARLLIGLRHPVSWFESLYNFRVQNLPPKLTLPHPNALIGACTARRYGTCTNKGDFAVSLMNLGKQNDPALLSSLAMESHDTSDTTDTDGTQVPEVVSTILSRYRKIKHNYTDVPYMPNPVFLFEVSQLGDADAVRNEQFRRDVSQFMGLNELLPAIPHAIPGKKRLPREQERRNERKISICDDEYNMLRQELMSLSRSNAEWIRTVFLKSPTVVVSSPSHFDAIMESWMTDPCDIKNANAQAAEKQR
jgi:hypothetical protein